jgi:hypothetical protein
VAAEEIRDEKKTFGDLKRRSGGDVKGGGRSTMRHG